MKKHVVFAVIVLVISLFPMVFAIPSGLTDNPATTAVSSVCDGTYSGSFTCGSPAFLAVILLTVPVCFIV
jgi:hypothetical protein